MDKNEKYITVTAERFSELEDWEIRARQHELILTIQVISRYHVCGESPNIKTFNLKQAEMGIRNGHGEVSEEINEAVRFNKEQIEEMKRQRHHIELDIDTHRALKKEFDSLCDRNGQRLSKIPKWIRRIFKAV